ncbi:MAG: outer membrane protein assembly factor BamE [Alphaproteobacteria bacterium]
MSKSPEGCPRTRVGAALGLVLIALGPLGLGACASPVMRAVVTKHGYIADQEKIDSLELGITSKAVVRESLGTPSSVATFDPDTWYYISSKQERFAFLNKSVTDRNILALKFDDTGMLAQVATYGLEDGKVVNYSSRETPTRGKELTFLEQMFGNVGRGLPGAGGLGGDPNQQGPGRQP